MLPTALVGFHWLQSLNMAMRKTAARENRDFVRVGKSQIQGRGVFAKRKLPKGTRIIEYIGDRIALHDSFRAVKAGEPAAVYVIYLDETTAIDGARNGNDARCCPRGRADIRLQTHRDKPQADQGQYRRLPVSLRISKVPRNDVETTRRLIMKLRSAKTQPRYTASSIALATAMLAVPSIVPHAAIAVEAAARSATVIKSSSSISDAYIKFSERFMKMSEKVSIVGMDGTHSL
jgi:hypothetical protein